MLDYPMNYKDPSESSVLNTLIVPFGRGIPNLFCLLLLNYMLLLAFKFDSLCPPEWIVNKLYFLTVML